MLGALSRTQPAGLAAGVLWRCLYPAAVLHNAAECLRWMSAAGGNAADTTAASSAAEWRQRFDGVAPGSVLRLSLPHTAANIAVKVGEHEAIELSSSSSELQAEQQPNPDHDGASVVTVASSSGTATGAPKQLEFGVRSPSRFLTIEASTAGGSFHVDVVQEGSLRVSTAGGDISVPKVKAVDAHLSSGGGAISGSVTGVDVCLSSGGGAISLKNLVGKKAEVRSGGGALTLGACYADDLALDSGGGPVRVTTMDCRDGTARLATGGGTVQLDSLDGNLEIDSRGGSIQVQLADNARHISVASGGGHIHLFLSPGLTGRLRVRNCGHVYAHSAALDAAQQQEDGSLLFRLPLESGATEGAPGAAASRRLLQSRLQRAEQAQERVRPPPGNTINPAAVRVHAGADIVLDAGGGDLVSLVQRGWMEALRQRWS